MTDLILPRRHFLKTLSGIIAAPAIVRADSLMKVVAPKFPKTALRTSLPPMAWRKIGPLLDIELPGPHTPSLWLVSWGEEESTGLYPSLPIPPAPADRSYDR